MKRKLRLVKLHRQPISVRMKQLRLFAGDRQKIVRISKTYPDLDRLPGRTDKCQIRLREFLHPLLHFIGLHRPRQIIHLNHYNTIVFRHNHHPVSTDKGGSRKQFRHFLNIVVFITGKHIGQDFSHF